MTHTHTDDTGTYDILKLLLLVEGQPSEEVLLSTIKGITKSKRTGFSWKRLKAADTRFPVLLGKTNKIIDGRHRAIKLIAEGRKTVQAIRPTAEQMEAAKIKTVV